MHFLDNKNVKDLSENVNIETAIYFSAATWGKTNF